MEAYLLDKYPPYGGAGSLIKSGVHLPGTAGNYISTPDSVLNSITGDIDIRVCVKMTDWTPAGSMGLVQKGASSPQFSYTWSADPAGTVTLAYSLNGTSFSFSSSTAHGFVDGTVGWLRCTRSASTGVIAFYKSTDGLTWTAIGGSTGLIGALFDSAQALNLGDYVVVGWLNGTIYYAEVRNGIDGPVVAKFDSSQIQVSGAQSPATINGWTWNGSALYKRDDYVRLPGTTGNYLSFPDTPANSVTGDIDIRVKLSMDDWTPAVTSDIFSKLTTTGNQRSWRFFVTTAGALEFDWSANGTALNVTSSSLNPTVTDGGVIWVRMTLSCAIGTVNYYTSVDGTTWVLLGTPQTGSGGGAATSIFDSTAPITISSLNQGVSEHLAGNVYYAEVRNGINGPVVASFNGADNQVQTPWTINGSGWNWEGSSFAGKPGIAYSAPQVNGNYISTPDTNALDITAALDIRVKVSLDNWNDGVNFQGLVGKCAAGQDAYQFRVNSDGTLGLLIFNAAANVSVNSPSAPGFAPGSVHWLRATFLGDNGAGGRIVSYYESLDNGVSWTPFYTLTTAGTKTIDVTTAALTIGAGELGVVQLMKGKLYYAEVRNGIDGPIVAKFDPTNMARTGIRTPASTVQPGGTPNLLTPNQASIETDASGWATATNTPTLARSTAQFLDGAASLSLTATAAGPTTMSVQSTPVGSQFPVVPGKLYTSKANTRSAAVARVFSVAINWYTAVGGYISTSSSAGQANTTSGWTEETVTALAPATAAFAVIVVTIAAVLSTEVHYLDRVSLVEAAEVWTLNGSNWDLVSV